MADCDRELRADPEFDRFHCTPVEFVCPCGNRFRHVCDEAEGCSWVFCGVVAER